MHNGIAITELLFATWQTIYMVFMASFISIVIGLIFGILLFVTNKNQLLANNNFYKIFGFVINVGRSIPFIILLISIIPITRFIVGSSIGTNAAIVPLAVAAIPFFARVSESALSEVAKGVVEAAIAFGATRLQIIYKVLISEALPSLIKGATLTVITLIGYSAMAGVVGGGGLGELAINYGYQQFNIFVMLQTVIILVILVQLVQTIGNKLAKKVNLKYLCWILVVAFCLCIIGQINFFQKNKNVLRVGIISGPQTKIMNIAKKVAKKNYNLQLEVINFDDYQLPNSALANGEIDANIFQHIPFLQDQIKTHRFKISVAAKTFLYPFGFYSKKIKNISELKNGDIVAIPNDPSNENRALLLLSRVKIISLRNNIGFSATPKDIIKNPRHLQFKLIDAASLPRVLDDCVLVGLTNDYVKVARFTLADALIKEDASSPYANVIAIQSHKKNDENIKKLILIMHSKPIIDITNKLFPNGSAIISWQN